MRVLEQHQHGLPRRQPRQLRQQRLERLLLAPLRHEVRERVFVAGRKRQQRGDEADLLGAGVRPGEQRFELGQPRFRHVLAAEARGVLERERRMERARLMVRRAEIAQPRVRLARRLLQHRLRQARFADTRFADQPVMARAGAARRVPPSAASRHVRGRDPTPLVGRAESWRYCGAAGAAKAGDGAGWYRRRRAGLLRLSASRRARCRAGGAHGPEAGREGGRPRTWAFSPRI